MYSSISLELILLRVFTSLKGMVSCIYYEITDYSVFVFLKVSGFCHDIWYCTSTISFILNINWTGKTSSRSESFRSERRISLSLLYGHHHGKIHKVRKSSVLPANTRKVLAGRDFVVLCCAKNVLC
jgi:hypothetical protein